jgi:hypothetical protein
MKMHKAKNQYGTKKVEGCLMESSQLRAALDTCRQIAVPGTLVFFAEHSQTGMFICTITSPCCPASVYTKTSK